MHFHLGTCFERFPLEILYETKKEVAQPIAELKDKSAHASENRNITTVNNLYNIGTTSNHSIH